MIKRICLVSVLASTLLLLEAQDITKGSLAGVVRDASGAVVTDAKVRLDTPTGERATTTN